MYVWSENIASRGGQEIGSCLTRHFATNISDDTHNVILYSDSCGGQNRNIKLSVMLIKLLSSHPTLRNITQKYFIPGHSYNSCDRCFGIIEKAKKMSSDLFIPDHWLNLIKEAKKSEPKFEVLKMGTENFFSTNELLQYIVNRKLDVDKRKINWLTFRSIQYSKSNSFKLIVNNDTVISLQKKSLHEYLFKKSNMKLLFPNGRKIDEKKYNDLMDLIKFIPEEHHSFYINLAQSSEQLDFGLASDDENNTDDSDIDSD